MLATVVYVYPRVYTHVSPYLHADLKTSAAETAFAALAAAGTLVLALATWRLTGKTSEVAIQTRRLAGETTELAKRTSEDVAAQFRPAIMPDADIGSNDPATYGRDSHRLRLRLLNAGHGPALDIQAIAHPGAKAPTSWHSGALPTGSRVWLEFTEVPVG